jgi:hypothetical protein
LAGYYLALEGGKVSISSTVIVPDDPGGSDLFDHPAPPVEEAVFGNLMLETMRISTRAIG